MNKAILSDVSRYYTEKCVQFGPTPRGVDWNGEESQQMRFAELVKIIPSHDSFSVTDFGCGYGALYDFLARDHSSFEYVGYDLSAKMIEDACRLHQKSSECNWVSDQEKLIATDYTIASGIFNVRMTHSDADWQSYVLETLQQMNALSSKGMSFNMLTSYSDHDKKREDLYYADPCFYFDYCKRHFSPRVSLLHDYPLYEFTILVRKGLS